eukprot:CAMPEP_0183708584 /NCGR_PEP_ID=MMETSP0737-20130205/4850_1 /TAXON_ID=385413 /ORGANISM="Thalassiosira miniscula, Strain CCMP1093" /LENGTH=494 /DNA_ID=CAMNT_0025936479 /DNA_START=197 /DNA_END=1681 /DNA_ORIENTATION=+
MSGYDAIPSVSVGSIEDGQPSLASTAQTQTHQIDDDRVRTSSSSVASLSSLASKLGYVSLGIIAGCAISSRGLLRWGPVAYIDSQAQPHASSSDRAQAQASSYTEHNRFIINGKSFFDSLPFEEVLPNSWNPAQPRPHEEKNLPHLSTIQNEETSVLSASRLSSSIVPSGSTSSSSSSSSSGPHLLYHAHESAFSLLYDSSSTSSSHLSEYGLDYFLLNAGFDAQINQAYCSVATVAAVLNSLKYAKRFRETTTLNGNNNGDSSPSMPAYSFDLPVDPKYDPYPYATQKDILMGDCVWNTVIEEGNGSNSENDKHGGHVDGILKPPYGLSMEQAGKLLECHTSEEWSVTTREVDPSSLALSRMRYEMKAALVDPDARLMINYDRKGLGQMGGGHFSPIGAYHAPTDSFLIMDVAKYKYPPVWVGADTLYTSLATIDKCGTYDYPKGQELLADNTYIGGGGKLFNPITREEYLQILELLNCKPKFRGYIILKKKA